MYITCMSKLGKRLLSVFVVLAAVAFFLVPQAGTSAVVTTQSYRPSPTLLPERPENYPRLVVAGGCFWCVESEFRRVEGVLYARSGYAGGREETPTYEDVSKHKTGHREAVEIIFDPDKVSYRDLVDFFMTRVHDPTQEDGQGPDIGPQYTSALFYADAGQKKVIEALLASYEKNRRFKKPVVTAVLPLTNFYPAEEYHQRYYEKQQARTGELPMNLWLRQQRENASGLFATDP